jgi:hypothetical protein
MSLRFGDGLANPLKGLAEIDLGQESSETLTEWLRGIDHGNRQIGLLLQLKHLMALHEDDSWPDL